MIEVNGFEELNKFIWTSHQEGKHILLYFGATWCGPCKRLKDKIKTDLEKDMPNLAVCYLDSDEKDNEELCEKYEIKSLPTQIFVKLEDLDIVTISTLKGFNWDKLCEEYRKLSA
jgi:thiol-disulfide isomerase/thioredoxin